MLSHCSDMRKIINPAQLGQSSLSHEPGQGVNSHLCQHCLYEMMSGTAGNTACSCIHQHFTQAGTCRAAAASPRRALGPQGWFKYVYWHINTPLSTWALRDPSLPDDALESPNWDLFPDLLSVQKKSWSWEMPQRDNLGMPTRAIRKVWENLKMWDRRIKTHLSILWNKTEIQHNLL